MTNLQEKLSVVATKVRGFVKDRLKRICAKKGITIYDMLQMMCDCIVRYMDDRHNLTEEMERVMMVFEHMNGWKDALNFADPTVNMLVDEAFYVLKDERGKKNGVRVVHVRRPFIGDWMQTENVQTILEDFLLRLIPERYWMMRDLAHYMECNNILDLLDTLIDAHTIEQLNAEMRKDFEDCNRHDFGKPVEYGQRTKRVPVRSIETIEQTTIRFDEEDVPDTSNESY